MQPYYSQPFYYSQPSYYYDPGATYAPSYAAPAAPVGAASITVNVPDPNAQVWFNGQMTRQGGTQRVFNTPSLESGYSYTYTIRAAWTQNGQPYSREQNVSVRPGE